MRAAPELARQRLIRYASLLDLKGVGRTRQAIAAVVFRQLRSTWETPKGLTSYEEHDV